MYIRFNTETKRVVFIGSSKPLNEETDLYKVAEFYGEIPQGDYLTVANVQEHTRVIEKAHTETILNEQGKEETIEVKEKTENYLTCDLIANFISEEVKEKQKNIRRIAELKSLLSATDYKAIKYAEGLISVEEYAPIKEERQAYREEINELEKRG